MDLHFDACFEGRLIYGNEVGEGNILRAISNYIVLIFKGLYFSSLNNFNSSWVDNNKYLRYKLLAKSIVDPFAF